MFCQLLRYFAQRKATSPLIARIKAQSALDQQARSLSLITEAFGPDFAQALQAAKGMSIAHFCKEALTTGPDELGKAWSVMSSRVLLRMAKEIHQSDSLKSRLLERDFALEAKDYLLKHYREEWESALALAKITDLRLPHEWFPRARELTRRIEYHWGPTNSGKTHAALNRLKTATNGVYCGPLRLLATEVYERLNAAGVKCNLLTGQEKIAVQGATHTACTIEMLDFDNYYDVAVVDEIQMIADSDRGSAWTHALLGLPCTEIHLTGDERAKGIVTSLMESTGDLLLMKEYKRLSPLTVQPGISKLEDLREGDCIVAFSRKTCHRLRSLIEKRFKCSIIYGNLPPETRRVQARRFNDRENAQVLVATDAIGLGLNYNISRVVFFETEKNDGKKVRPLTGYEIRQIAGRAGRHLQPGFVTAMDPEDCRRVKQAIEHKLSDTALKRAALFPPFDQFQAFANDLQTHSNHTLTYSEILHKFADLVHLDGQYFLQHMTDVVFLAQKLQHVPMALKDVFTFTHAPVRVKIVSNVQGIIRFAEDFQMEKKVRLRTIRDKGDKLEKLEHTYFRNE